jgi:hypothetical protein
MVTILCGRDVYLPILSRLRPNPPARRREFTAGGEFQRKGAKRQRGKETEKEFNVGAILTQRRGEAEAQRAEDKGREEGRKEETER